MNITDFTLGCAIDVDDPCVSQTLDAEPYRVHWIETGTCEIQIMNIEHNDARFGNPAIWVPAALPYYVTNALRKVIERGLRDEREQDMQPSRFRYIDENTGIRKAGPL